MPSVLQRHGDLVIDLTARFQVWVAALNSAVAEPRFSSSDFERVVCRGTGCCLPESEVAKRVAGS
jgi:hypothetical protein